MSSGLVISFRSTRVLFMQSCLSGPISSASSCSGIVFTTDLRLWCQAVQAAVEYTVKYHSIPRPLSCISAKLLVVCPGVSYRGHDLLFFGPAPHPSRLLVSKASLR
jgi:hypothetical protein